MKRKIQILAKQRETEVLKNLGRLGCKKSKAIVLIWSQFVTTKALEMERANATTKGNLDAMNALAKLLIEALEIDPKSHDAFTVRYLCDRLFVDTQLIEIRTPQSHD